MPVTDPIADMLTRIRNAVRLRHERVRVRSSSVVLAIAGTLQEEGFIHGFEIVAHPGCAVQNDLEIRLKYGADGTTPITRIDRISRPGRRIYRQSSELRPVLRGLGILVLSTPKGVMSDRQARAAHVGGEVLCQVE